MLFSKMLSNPTQIIIFNKAGYIVESSDTLFKAKEIGNESIYQHFPLIESIFDAIPGKDPKIFPRVETKSILLPGVYDFHIKNILRDNIAMIEWKIEDRTHEYDFRRVEQQNRQERIIAKQRQDVRNVFEK